jgi:hypothetical protein
MLEEKTLMLPIAQRQNKVNFVVEIDALRDFKITET